jgi:hypothetical protein
MTRWLLLALALVGCDEELVPEPDRAERAAPYVAFVKHLGTMRSEAAKVSREQACGEGALARLDGGDGRLLLLDADANAGEPWRWLTSPPLAALPPPRSLDTSQKVTGALYGMQRLRQDYQYLAVVHAPRRTLPRLDQGKFHPGEWSGWLVLFELESGRALCQTELRARSSDEIAGQVGQAPERAVLRDFVLAVRREIERATTRLSRQLNAELG